MPAVACFSCEGSADIVEIKDGTGGDCDSAVDRQCTAGIGAKSSSVDRGPAAVGIVSGESEDAIADFVRSLKSADKIAFYSYSRDLSRASVLTSDRSQVLRDVFLQKRPQHSPRTKAFLWL